MAYAGNIEVKSKRIGWTVTIVVHAIILLFFWWYNVWPFNPPALPDYGTEINFGISDVGSGDVQNTNPPSDENTENNEEAAASAASAQSAAESAESETEEDADINEAAETAENDDSDVSASETNESQTSSESQSTSEQETEAETDNDADTESDNPKDSNSDSEATNDNESDGAQQNNNGDDANETGDKGQEDGKINDKDIYHGQAGGGGGTGAHITGWIADGRTKECEKSAETGKIIFKIKIDEDGEMVSVKVIESTVSAATVSCYQDQIEQLSFTPKDSNDDPAEFSEGTYTVNLGN